MRGFKIESDLLRSAAMMLGGAGLLCALSGLVISLGFTVGSILGERAWGSAAVLTLSALTVFAWHRVASVGSRLIAEELKVLELKALVKSLQSSLGDTTHSNEYLALASARFEELFHGVPFACFTVDRNGTVFEWNETSSEVFERPAFRAIQHSIYEGFFDKDGSEQIRRAIESAITGGTTRDLELSAMVPGDGRVLLVNVFGIGFGDSKHAALIACADISRLKRAEAKIAEQNASLNRAMVQLSDTAVTLDLQRLELEQLNDALTQMATTDGLTGLINHRTMQEKFRETMARSVNDHSRTGFVLLDVDHFKSLNDVYGHQSGDEVLKRVSKILEASVRETDITARYGGEEFCVIMPNTTPYECKLMCEHIRCNVANSILDPREVTVSVGFIVGDSNQAPADLINCADQALYRAKNSGRNRVCMYEPPLNQCA